MTSTCARKANKPNCHLSTTPLRKPKQMKQSLPRIFEYFDCLKIDTVTLHLIPDHKGKNMRHAVAVCFGFKRDHLGEWKRLRPVLEHKETKTTKYHLPDCSSRPIRSPKQNNTYLKRTRVPHFIYARSPGGAIAHDYHFPDFTKLGKKQREPN